MSGQISGTGTSRFTGVSKHKRLKGAGARHSRVIDVGGEAFLVKDTVPEAEPLVYHLDGNAMNPGSR